MRISQLRRAMVRLLCLAMCFGQASGFSSASTSRIYEGLASTPLVRASDSSLVPLTTLWRSGTPFGIADEVAVCAFLRHYG